MCQKEKKCYHCKHDDSLMVTKPLRLCTKLQLINFYKLLTMLLIQFN